LPFKSKARSLDFTAIRLLELTQKPVEGCFENKEIARFIYQNQTDFYNKFINIIETVSMEK
jgi:hypothetical protein